MSMNYQVYKNKILLNQNPDLPLEIQARRLEALQDLYRVVYNSAISKAI
ncbi:hypothetical protein [Aliterella atlantica]|nr:hypothetical protein [Aliterella atlantica]